MSNHPWRERHLCGYKCRGTGRRYSSHMHSLHCLQPQLQSLLGRCTHEHVRTQTHQNLQMLYLVSPLVAATQSALHGVAPLNAYFPPYYNPSCGLFGFLHDKATAAHAKCWGNVAQYLRQSL